MKIKNFLYGAVVLILINLVILCTSFIVYSNAVNACDNGSVEYSKCLAVQLTSVDIMLNMYLVLLVQIVIQIVLIIIYVIKKMNRKKLLI